MIETKQDFRWKGDYFSEVLLHGGSVGFEGKAFIVRGFTTPPPEPRGTLMGGAPISDLEYRRQHGSRCGYKVVSPKHLEIYCDWGRLHWVKGPANFITALVAELDAQEIPNMAKVAVN